MAKIKVVVAESQENRLSALRSSLKKGNIQVVACQSGFEALKEILSNSCDLVLISDQLEDIDGFRMCALLKSNNVTSRLPVVIMTADQNKKKTFWKQACLANAIMPCQKEDGHLPDLVDLIKRLVESQTKVDSKQALLENRLLLSTAKGSTEECLTALVDELLIERLIRHSLESLLGTIDDRKAFAGRFFGLLESLFMPELAGIIINDPEHPLCVCKSTKAVPNDDVHALSEKAQTLLGLKRPIQEETMGEVGNGKAGTLKKSEIAIVQSEEGTIFGAIFIAWSDERLITPPESYALNCLKEQMQPIFRLLSSRNSQPAPSGSSPHLSTTDPFTGLYNIEFFMGFLQQQLLFSRRHKLPVGLCIICLDDFAELGNRHGTEACDLILRSLAERISKCTRASDLIARYSTDQFAIVLPNTDVNGAKVLGEKLRGEVTKLYPSKNGDPKVSISVGCSQFDFNEPTPEAILKDAKTDLLKNQKSVNLSD